MALAHGLVAGQAQGQPPVEGAGMHPQYIGHLAACEEGVYHAHISYALSLDDIIIGAAGPFVKWSGKIFIILAISISDDPRGCNWKAEVFLLTAKKSLLETTRVMQNVYCNKQICPNSKHLNK